MPILLLVKPRAYHDSVSLMAASQQLAQAAGVDQAVLVMGTAHNKALLQDSGLLTADGATAQPDDLIIALQGADLAALEQAAAGVAALLSRKSSAGGASGSGGQLAPRTLRSALRQLPEATLAVISVPGAFAAYEARQALISGLDVLLFSDNVSLEAEIELKQLARAKGLLCMGPDCGTALLDGVGLGFANVVRRGSIGIVSASGTGAQEVAVLIDRYGGGISQIIGTGGRDLKPEVGGLMMLAGIERLAQDPDTEWIVLISKPPDPAVAATVLQALQASGKRGLVCFLGYTGGVPAGLEQAASLHETALLVMGQRPEAEHDHLPAELAGRLKPGQRLRGLFSGGTLCDEARLELARLGMAAHSDLVDYGDDQYTQGRPHPMIDWTLRLAELRRVAADPTTGAILLDIVLGHSAHPDPASLLSPLLGGIGQPVIVYVCGSDGDPQSYRRQVAQLAAAGAIVPESNLAAARLAGLLLKEANR